MKKEKITCADIEIALTQLFNVRQNYVATNISWGWDIHECDMLVVTKSMYCYEIEIKVSLADLKKDASKRHSHVDYKRRLKYLYFAIPQGILEKALPFIPDGAGIITCAFKNRWDDKISLDDYTGENCMGVIANLHRHPEQIKGHRPITEKELLGLLRLQAMRTWDLKRSVNSLKKELKRLKTKLE